MAAAAGVLYRRGMVSDSPRVHPNFEFLLDGVVVLKVPLVHLRDNIGTASNGLLARLAVPDTNGVALDSVLSAEGTRVAGVLGDFHLLHLLTQGSTISIREKLVSPGSKSRLNLC